MPTLVLSKLIVVIYINVKGIEDLISFIGLALSVKNKVEFLFSFFYTFGFNFSFIQAETSKATKATGNKFDEKDLREVNKKKVVFINVQGSLIHWDYISDELKPLATKTIILRSVWA